MKKILLQTTNPYIQDDWSIERFSTLAKILSDSSDDNSNRNFEVVSRNRDNQGNADDGVLKRLDDTDFDQLWLFGVDVGAGITPMECEAIARFRARGGGLLTSRDHQDLGLSFYSLAGIGDAHHFHSRNSESDPARLVVDDTETSSISYPNYHSGKNGDYQHVAVMEPIHPVMRSNVNRSGKLERLPSHPHEGANSIPTDVKSGRVIAMGTSILTRRTFNLALAFEADGEQGRAIIDSSFHHFLDFNLDPDEGCPSFVSELVGSGMKNNAQARTDTETYFSIWRNGSVERATPYFGLSDCRLTSSILPVTAPERCGTILSHTMSQTAKVFGLSEYEWQMRNRRSNEGSNHENRSDRRHRSHRIKACQ